VYFGLGLDGKSQALVPILGWDGVVIIGVVIVSFSLFVFVSLVPLVMELA
jgi:hypothetical protein